VSAARVYGGMHYRNSTEVGALLGERVVHQMLRHHFRRVEDRRRGGDEDEGEDD